MTVDRIDIEMDTIQTGTQVEIGEEGQEHIELTNMATGNEGAARRF